MCVAQFINFCSYPLPLPYVYSRNIDVNIFMIGLALAPSLKNVELISHATQSTINVDQICHQSSDKCESSPKDAKLNLCIVVLLMIYYL